MQKLSIQNMILISFQLFFCFCLCFFFIPCLSSGVDTLDVNQSLSGDQTLISLDENFELGFFKPGESPNYYIGIWYKKVSSNPPTVVWVANRETPVSSRFKSKLKMLDGNLVLLNESNTQIWSTDMIPTDTSSASVILLDDGNLVLRNGSSSSLPIWQSFDHPTHTFLPGSKLGYDKQTNRKQVITSWRSTEDPAEGLFSLEIDQKASQYLLRWNKSVEYWTSGSWNGRIFSLVPEMRLNYIYNFSYVTNENENYFTYSLYDPSTISRLIIDGSGQIKQLSWLESTQEWNLFWSQPRTQCEVHAVCGAFGNCRRNGFSFCNCLTGFKPRSESEYWNQRDFSGGCVRKTNLDCTVKEENPGFITSYVPLKYLLLFLENGTSLSDESACRRSCLDECSCDAYSFILKTCCLWNNENLNNISLVFVSDNANSVSLNIKVSSSDLPNPSNPAKINTKVLVAGIVSGFSGLVFLCSIAVIFYRSSVKRREKKRSLVGKTTMEGLLVAFVYRDLQIATKNFSDKLGGGGFGSVFKGVVRDSSVVAVKKLDSINQGEKQFRSEISTIGTTKHVHLVRLRGFCAQGNNRLLVYDYMPNGSLDSHLFHDKPVLNWKTRYEIALGIARGLVYLHEKCRDCIIHCDIKPENILLDADFFPKIADFGLAKLVGRDFSRVLTTFRGTRGYLAPEWLSGVAVTAKADVFSYGMLLFELVNGKRNAERSKDSSRCTFFPYLAASIVMVGGDILSLLDRKLNREANIEEVIKICKVAFWCIQDEEESRPSMSVVERILEGVLDVNMPPVPRSIRLSVDNTEPIVFFTESSSQGSSQAYSIP